MRVGNSIKEYVLLIDMAESASITKQSKNMNYIAEINSFYDWLEINQISSNAINLWHALMSVANKASWQPRFTVAISVLELKTGLKRRTLERARNELSQKGRITWKKRNGNLAAEYSLISLCDKKYIKFDAQSVAQADVQTNVQVVAQPVDINKLNNTKQSISINSDEANFISPLNETLDLLLEDMSWKEILCMTYKIHDFETIENYLKQFFAELAARGEKYKDEKDAKFHFANWLKCEISREKEKRVKTKKSTLPINDFSNQDKVYKPF